MRRSDSDATTGKLSGPEPLGKNPKERDFVVETGEERVADVEVRKEREPTFVPDFVGGFSSIGSDGLAGRCLRKAEITFEMMPGGGVCIRQEVVWGAIVLMSVSNAEFDKSKRRDAASATTLQVPLTKT